MSNLPTHAVYSIKDRGEDQKAFWLKIGSAWTTCASPERRELAHTGTVG
jgi:hypothetical protein